MAMQCLPNGNKRRHPKLGEGVEKIVVMGEPQVGKSTFIRAYCQNHEPGVTNSHQGVRWTECEFEVNGAYSRAAVFEIPGDNRFFKAQRKPHYKDANVIVLMYAIDDPPSLDMLIEKWLPEAMDAIESEKIPVMAIGNKKDLRDDQKVIDRLAVHDKIPVTPEQGQSLLLYREIKDWREISATNLDDVNDAFDRIFNWALSMHSA